MIVPNENYRPNSQRALYIHGPIDQALVYRTTPRIIQLQNASRAPITIYIDSPGGNLAHMETLWRLLTASNQNSDSPCRIITVVTARAASAAADLLASGDYAVAFPQSTILYHGSRTLREVPLTVETTTSLAQFLRFTNELYATELIRKIESRFMFRFLVYRDQFEEIRRNNARRTMADSECFLELVSDRLSEKAKKLFQVAMDRRGRYDQLLAKVKSQRIRKNSPLAKVEAARLRAIIEFELEENKNNRFWTFQNGGLTRLTDDFFLLSEHLASPQDRRLNRVCLSWGKLSLSKEDEAEISAASEAKRDELTIQKVRPRLEPLWSFFVALCHTLQEGETELTATDAFWLGLIDEVMGNSKLRAYRLMAEYQEDPPQPSAIAATAPAAAADSGHAKGESS